MTREGGVIPGDQGSDTVETIGPLILESATSVPLTRHVWRKDPFMYAEDLEPEKHQGVLECRRYHGDQTGGGRVVPAGTGRAS